MIKIQTIQKASPADKAGLKPDDSLISINGSEINDSIDLTYAGSDNPLEFYIEREGKRKTLSAQNPKFTETGITAEPFRIRRCNNRCIFCFVDQMPKGLRPTLYVKDEDYRLSFLDGSYICATNLSEKDFARIEAQRLSPLYVSVHATDEPVRKKLLNNRTAPPILDVIDRFISKSIQLHTQIVLCPGINDGKILKKTVDDLVKRAPDILSIAIVPLGLTKHRENLPNLTPLSAEYVKSLVKTVAAMQKAIRQKHRTNFLYLADEIYIRAGAPLPVQSHYGDFHQYENGVGMMRDFITGFTRELLKVDNLKLRSKKSALVLTAVSAFPYIKKLFSLLSAKTGVKFSVSPVYNTLMGDSVTVTGLLSGNDMAETALSVTNPFERIIIPPNTLNTDGLTLDGLTLNGLSKITGKPVAAPKSLKEIL
ncbi:MAG: DUF512 domain-containing protein [Fibrobacteres bacterium]|nr:DUF512 domain-containing protein [Fibrobacterota bacterium]